MATAEAPSHGFRPTDLADRRFPLIRRGYDPASVDPFLAAVGEQMARLEGEVAWLRARSEHFERRSASANDAAYSRVARDFVGLLRKADQAAEQVRAGAEQVRAVAEEEARELIDSAHLEADRILAEAREEAERVRSAEFTGPLHRSIWSAEPSPDRPRLEAAPGEVRLPNQNGRGHGEPGEIRRLDVEADLDLHLDIDLDIELPPFELDDPRFES